MPPLKHNKDLPGSKSGTTAWYCGPTLIPPPAEGGRGRSVTRVGPSGPYNQPPQKTHPAPAPHRAPHRWTSPSSPPPRSSRCCCRWGRRINFCCRRCCYYSPRRRSGSCPAVSPRPPGPSRSWLAFRGGRGGGVWRRREGRGEKIRV